MAFMTVKLVPGVHAEQTPLLLQAGVIQSNNVRWRDGLPEKIGGWKKFIANLLPGPLRELWTWEDLNGPPGHLAAAGGSTVTVITNPTGPTPAQQVVTPLYEIRNNPIAISRTAGSSLVDVFDTLSNANIYESITLQTPIQGDPVIYPGNYPVVSVTDADHFTIDVGVLATSTGTGFSPLPATITSVNGSESFTVNLPIHHLAKGDNFSIVLPTVVGGVTLSGFYTVATVSPPDTFTIVASSAATSVETVNYGNVGEVGGGDGCQYLLWVVVPPLGPVSITASGAFTNDYTGIAMPPNPGWVTAGLPVLDNTLGVPLGTVQSYGSLTVTQVAAQGWNLGDITINMAPATNAPGIVPGAQVYDVSVGLMVGNVGSYIGNTLTLDAPALIASTAFPRASNGYVDADYRVVQMADPNPGTITAGMEVTDVTLSGNVLGTVESYGPPVLVTQNAAAAWPVGVYTINMGSNTAFAGPICPGMFVYDMSIAPFTANPDGHTDANFLGIVTDYTGNTLNYSPYLVLASAGSNDLLGFVTPGPLHVLKLTSNFAFTGGFGDTLGFPALSHDTLDFFCGDVLVLTAPIAFNSSGASDALSFNTGPPPGPPAGSVPVSGVDWCMFNFGSTLLMNPQDGPIFAYDPTSGLGSAQLVPNAPSKVHGMFLAMPQQMAVAYGASTQGVQDPMLVAWCDAGDFNTWKLAADNQAGTFRLSRGSQIVGGMQTPMQAMLWTDVGMWLMTYIGYPDVWGFSEVAQECGLIAKKAVGAIGSQVFWMGQEKFWTFTGGQVQPLPCEVWDAVFQNLNKDLAHLIRCGTDTGFDGIGWFFPSLATKQPGALQENDSYVKFNRVTGEWDYGTPVDIYGDGATGGAMISDWIDANVFGNPISAMTDSTGTQSQLMWMDMGPDADGQPIHWWFRTGLFLLSEGEDYIFVDRCRPDFRWRKFSAPTTPGAEINITLYAQDDSDNPAKPPSVYGPFPCTESSGPFDPRARGRYFSLKVEGDDLGSFARLGAVKFRFSPDGRAG